MCLNPFDGVNIRSDKNVYQIVTKKKRYQNADGYEITRNSKQAI
nr:MAG TPA_asm: hypothetical protein [Caudoviricetes sp.]